MMDKEISIEEALANPHDYRVVFVDPQEISIKNAIKHEKGMWKLLGIDGDLSDAAALEKFISGHDAKIDKL